MTELELQQVLSAYTNRGLETYTQGDPAVNLIRVALNNAKKWAQRNLDFELARKSVLVSVNVDTGGLLSSAVDQMDATTQVQVNRIERAFLGYGQVGAAASTYSYRPIKISSKATMGRRNEVAWRGVEKDLATSDIPQGSGVWTPTLIRQGDKIYISPVTQELSGSVGGGDISVGLDVVAWMPDYSDTVQTDFFLDYCQDWLMLHALRELNFFLKDANRVGVTSGLREEAWEVVRTWNTSLMSNDDLDLS